MSRDADRVKEAVGVETFARILEELGGVLSKSQRGRSSCPIHGGDSHDTLHFNEKAGAVVWNCFKGCGKPGGDVFDLVSAALGIPFPEAVEWVGERAGVSDEKRPPRPAQKAQEKTSPSPGPEVGEARSTRLKRLWGTFKTEDAQAEAYLRNRKIEPDPEHVRFNAGGTGDEEVDGLARNGFRIVVPLRGPGGEIRSFSFRLARDLSDAEKKEHPNWRTKWNLKGETDGACYAVEPATSWKSGDAVLFTEGLTDTLSAQGLGYLTTGKGNRVRVIGTPGAAQAVKIAETLGPDLLQGRHVLIALDRDSAGDGAAAQLARVLRSMGAIPYRIRTRAKDLCLELSSAPGSPLVALTDLITAAAEEGPWNPDARDAGAEWLSGLEEWEVSIEKKGISTGMHSVDALLGGGLWDRRMIVIAGNTGSGKSALALSWVRHVAQETPVFYVSYELEPFEIRARLIAHETGIFYGKVCSPSRLTIHERERVRAAWGAFARGIGKRIYISVPGPTGEKNGPKPGSVGWIHAQARAITETAGRPPVVFVDYLQPAASFTENYDPRSLRIAVGNTALELRQLSRDLGVPIVALSSIPRGAYATPRKGYQRPEFDALKESGEIEFGADTVAFLWPEENDWNEHEGNAEGTVKRDSTRVRPMLFTVAKGRTTGTGETVIDWNPPLGLFTDTGRKPAREEKPVSSSAPGKKPALTVEALGNVIMDWGKKTAEGQWEIESDRLFTLAKDRFGATKQTAEVILAKHPERFERAKHERVPFVVYRRGDEPKPGELVEIFPTGGEA